MAKQMQDAYIVAATRTPVGKAPRGALRSTRPDSMLAHVLQSVLAQVPAIDPARVEDVIVGCAMPEAEQGMNVARIGLLLAGLPKSVAGNDDQPLLLVGAERGVDRRRPHPHRRGRHHDRRRHREHEHDPDDGRGSRRTSTCSRATRTSASPTGWGSPRRRLPSGGRSRARTRTRSRSRRTKRRSRRRRRASSPTRSRPIRCAITCRISPPGRSSSNSRTFDRDEGPRADTQRRGAREAEAGVRGEGLGDRRQQLADVRRRRRGRSS